MSKAYTTEQAANYLGISPARIRQFILDKRLIAEKNGRDHLIDFAELTEFKKMGENLVVGLLKSIAHA